MSKAYNDHRVYEFGDFILDVDRASLYRAGKEITLRPQAFDVLHYLVDRQGKIVSRDELHDAIWGATVVTDDAVTQCLTDIRKVLDDASQSIVRTVPRRGYVFELPVTRPANSADAARFRKAAYTRLGQGVVAIAIIGLLAIWMSTSNDRSTEPQTAAPVEIASTPTIAVLPFTVRSDDESQSYFADGVSDEILNLLARQRGLKVIARTSSFSFRGSEVDIATVAEELGVTHVLEGGFRKDGDRIRIGVQLIDASTSEYLWTESYERAFNASSIFAIQDEIALAVSESLKAELPGLEYNTLARIPTDNLEALDAYFEGRAKMETRHVARLDEASTLFERAIELDPDFALAHVALADVSFLRNLYGSLPVSAALQRVEAAVDAAFAISDQVGEAYLPLGTFLLWRYGDVLGAERAYLQGIELSPNYAPLYQWYAALLNQASSQPHEAIPYAKMAVALDPRSAIIIVDYANALREARELDLALEQYDLAIEIDPALAAAYLNKAWLLREHKGEIAEAVLLIEQANRTTPHSRVVINELSAILIDLGDFDRAEALINEAMAIAPGHGWARLSQAYMQVHRGNLDEAVDSARTALQDAPAHPGALAILRDHYIREREHGQAFELYRSYYPPLFEESSESFELRGWAYPVAIDLSVLLIEMGRLEFAEKLLAAALGEAERRQQLGIGPPDIARARIHALLGDSDAAIDALQDAVDRSWRTGWRLALYHDRALDSLRDLPEFQRIVAHIESDMERQRRELQ
ncbi:MAG: winged helix-turn-helix domain-containing protein [Woeseiaceae bacterium]|nr:winged helix-turn-helix domain-containing protein [Woeseiaceae bacterium]